MAKNTRTDMENHWLNLLICLVVVMNTRVLGTVENIGAGQVREIGGLKCYVSGTTSSKISVILASDVYGYEVPHLRQIADKVGAAGIYTLVPDFFHGDPYVSGRNLSDWKKNHQPINGTKDAKAIIQALQRKGITKIGAAGFCWGGKVAVDLAKSSYIQAAVLLHPTNVTAEDIQGVKVPISILEGQNDASSPQSLLEQYKSALKAKPEVDSFIKIFPGAGHGWTTKYNDTDAVAVKRAHEAYKDMLDWFLKSLK